jgi:hypothetical protein
MRPFMFLCPNTRYIVQGQADDAVLGKSHTGFIRFRALPADEVTSLILQRLTCRTRRAAQCRTALNGCCPLGTTLNPI